MKAFKVLMTGILSILSICAFAQDTAIKKAKKQTMKMDQIKYSCPMHPDVTSTKAGKCSKCGMDLKKSDNSKMTNTYACPMHPEVTSDKAGKCSKCGMDLKSIKEDEHADHQH